MLLYSVFALIGLATIGYTACGVAITRRLIRRHVSESHNEVLVPIFLTGGTIYAVFLAFLVVSVWALHDGTHADVADEASGLATMYRASAGMEPISGNQLRHMIRTYTEDVIDNEWPIQEAGGGTSDTARTLAVNMFQLFGNLNAAAQKQDSLIDQTQLQLLTQTLAARNTRVLEAGESLSAVMWIAAIASGALVIAMTFFLYMRTQWLQILLASFLSTMICMMLCITYMLSHPFAGPLAISSDAFKHSMFVYDNVDLGR